MANRKITLKDSTGADNLYPATFTSQVFDENENNLDTLLSDLKLTAGTGIDITNKVISTTKRILYTEDISSTTTTSSGWQNLANAELTIPAGTWFIIAEYCITGSSSDVGIRVTPSPDGYEMFEYSGANTSWRYPITYRHIKTFTSETTVRIQYYAGANKTISYRKIIAIDL